MSEIHPTALIGEGVELGEGTTVGPFAVIEDGVKLGKRNKVWTRAFIGSGTTLGDDNEIHMGAVIGHLPQDVSFDPATETFTRIGDRNVFREYSQVHRATQAGEATTIGDDNLLMALSHIAHDCTVGNRVILVNQASLPGHCEVGDRVLMSGFTGIHQFCRIGQLAMVSALSVSNKDLPPFFIFGGRPARAEGVNVVGLRRAGLGADARQELRNAFRLLYRSELTIPEATDAIERECKGPQIEELVAFIRSSKRGIALGATVVADSLGGKAHERRRRGS